MKSQSILAAAFAAASVSGAQAASIVVPNGSFEAPVVTGVSPYYLPIPNDDGVSTGAWLGYNGFRAVVEAGRYGVAPAGLDGTQFGDLEAKGSMGIFQDIAAYDGSGSPNQYWQSGFTYTLQIGVFQRSDNPLSVTSAADLRLFGREARSGAIYVPAGLRITSGSVLSNAVTDFTVSYTVLPSDPFVGKPIGIWMESVSGTGGDWGFDNVRLDFVAIPEPSAALLGGLGLLGLLRRWR